MEFTQQFLCAEVPNWCPSRVWNVRNTFFWRVFRRCCKTPDYQIFKMVSWFGFLTTAMIFWSFFWKRIAWFVAWEFYMHTLTFVQNPEQCVEIFYIPSWALTTEKTCGAFPTKRLSSLCLSLVCVCLKLSIYGLLPRNMNTNIVRA